MNFRRRIPDALRQLICRIDMTAFAAILFVLVTAFAVHPVAEYSTFGLPHASHGVTMDAVLREDRLLIAVTRDDRIYFNSERVNSERLAEAIRGGLSAGAEHRVYIRADKRARYGTVKEVLDGVRTAGIEQVGFLVDGPSLKPDRVPSNR